MLTRGLKSIFHSWAFAGSRGLVFLLVQRWLCLEIKFPLRWVIIRVLRTGPVRRRAWLRQVSTVVIRRRRGSWKKKKSVKIHGELTDGFKLFVEPVKAHSNDDDVNEAQVCDDRNEIEIELLVGFQGLDIDSK